MSIAELLTEDLIQPSLKGKTKYEVIEELLDLLVAQGKVQERQVALQDLIEREQYLSTGLENGLAVPHAKTTASEDVLVAFGLSQDGLDFDSLDGKPAHFIFLVLSPRDTSGPHIKILAQITRNFREGGIGPKLQQCNNAREILNIIQQFK